MVRGAVALVITALLLPVPVQAAPFGEVPPEFVEHDYALTDCARPTGLPGGFVAPVGLHRYYVDNGAQFFEATPGGLVAGPQVVFSGTINDCAVAAAQPSGAGVVAAPMDDSDTIGYALREPRAAAWSPVASVPTERPWLAVTAPAVAVSPAGDAVMAWVETPLIEPGKPLASRLRSAGSAARQGNRLRVARRVAGQAFGAPETLGSLPAVFPPALQVGIASGGEAIVAVTLVSDTRRAPLRGSVLVTTAAPGAAFGAPVRVGTFAGHTDTALALAPDGHALLSLADTEGVVVAERAPGASFTAPVRVARAGDPLGFDTSVALDPTGAAAVTWSGKALGGVGIATRAGPGPFGPAQTIATADASIRYDVFAGISAADFGYLASPINLAPGAWGYDRARHSLALAGADAVLAWSDPSGGQTLATVPLVGGPATTASVPADDTTPLPAVTVGTPLDSSLRATQELVLPVTCDTPCEVRGQVGGSTRSLRLPRGGASRLHLRPTGPLAPTRPGPVTVRITSSALDGRTTQARDYTFALRRAKSRPLVTRLRVARRGAKLHVSWNLDPRIRDSYIAVTGARNRRRDVEPFVWAGGKAHGGLQSADLPAAGVRWVTLRWSNGLRTVRVR